MARCGRATGHEASRAWRCIRRLEIGGAFESIPAVGSLRGRKNGSHGVIGELAKVAKDASTANPENARQPRRVSAKKCGVDRADDNRTTKCAGRQPFREAKR